MTVAVTTLEAGLSGEVARQAAIEAGLTHKQAELLLPGEEQPQAGQAGSSGDGAGQAELFLSEVEKLVKLHEVVLGWLDKICTEADARRAA